MGGGEAFIDKDRNIQTYAVSRTTSHCYHPQTSTVEPQSYKLYAVKQWKFHVNIVDSVCKFMVVQVLLLVSWRKMQRCTCIMAVKLQWLLLSTTRININEQHSAHSVYLSILYDSQNKEWLLLYTALTNWPL